MKHIEPAQFKKDAWAVVYAKNNYEEANLLYSNLIDASKAFGVKVEEP